MFNSVIVPKRDGDFNEIDVLTVLPMGIHVIEAKARVGTFYGNSLSEKMDAAAWFPYLRDGKSYTTEFNTCQLSGGLFVGAGSEGTTENYQSAFAYKKCCTVYTFGHQ